MFALAGLSPSRALQTHGTVHSGVSTAFQSWAPNTWNPGEPGPSQSPQAVAQVACVSCTPRNTHHKSLFWCCKLCIQVGWREGQEEFCWRNAYVSADSKFPDWDDLLLDWQKGHSVTFPHLFVLFCIEKETVQDLLQVQMKLSAHPLQGRDWAADALVLVFSAAPRDCSHHRTSAWERLPRAVLSQQGYNRHALFIYTCRSADRASM